MEERMEDKSYKDVERSHSGFTNDPCFNISPPLCYAHVYMVYLYPHLYDTHQKRLLVTRVSTYLFFSQTDYIISS